MNQGRTGVTGVQGRRAVVPKKERQCLCSGSSDTSGRRSFVLLGLRDLRVCNWIEKRKCQAGEPVENVVLIKGQDRPS